MYKVEITPAAQRQVKKLTTPVQKRVIERIKSLGADPRPHGAEKLSGMSGLYRIRAGKHRIIYTIRDKALLVLVVKVGDRKEIYRFSK